MMYLGNEDEFSGYFAPEIEQLRGYIVKDKSKKTLCVDFDATIAQHTIPIKDPNIFSEPPLTDAVKWMQEIIQYFNLVIFTARVLNAYGIENLYDWLVSYGFPTNIFVTNVKPSSGTIFLDDRSINFSGNYLSVQELQDFTPWHTVRSSS